jgi:hypothetical protein
MKGVLLAVFCLLTAGQPLLAASLVPGDFASGCSLPVTDGNAIHALDLPLAVYEKAVRADLGDLRVFNGAGEAVPHALRRLPEKIEHTRQPVPFFPLPGKQQPSSASDLSLRVTRNAEGAIITVDSGSTTTAQSHTASYLFDTTKLERRPTELEVQWSGPAGILTVSLAQSSDLTHWSPLVSRAVLADLTYNGGNISARRILLPGNTLPYIRLDCIDCRQPLHVREVTALSGTPVTADQWQWVRLAGTRFTEENNMRIIEYRLEANIMVTAVQLGFPAANSLLRATVESRPKTGGPWRHVAQADFYRLDLEGKSLANPLVPCAPTSSSDWRVKVIAENAGLSSNAHMPQLELGWRQEQLVFLGRGDGPYTLAFGSAKAAEDDSPLHNNLVLAALRETKSETHIRRIEPGPVQTLGGDQALKPRLSAASWKKILLWTVLVAGVVLLALMTRTIIREMRANKT